MHASRALDSCRQPQFRGSLLISGPCNPHNRYHRMSDRSWGGLTRLAAASASVIGDYCSVCSTRFR